MTGKFWIRSVGALTCMAAVATGWDAEAARWHRHCRTSCCEPVCCETVYYEPVCCAPVCEPACVTVVTERPRCCVAESGYRVISETIVVPSRPCCDSSVATVRNETPSNHIASATATAPQPLKSVKAVTAALAR